MKQEDIDRWEAEARANGVTLDAEMMEKWERYERDYGGELDFAEMKEWEHDEARSRIEDEALKMMYDYFSRKYEVKTYNHVSEEYEAGIADAGDELVDFSVVFAIGLDRFEVYTAGEEAKLYKITTEHAKEHKQYITEFEHLWREDQTAEEMAESGIALLEKAMEYAKTWDGMSPGARFGKSLMNKLKRRM